MSDPSQTLDQLTMVVLQKRFEAINREMAYTLARTGRSGVLNTALDFSCTMTDARHRTVSAGQGLPIHTGAAHLVPKAVRDRYGDNVREGDCFINNSSYLGNTHCADVTLCAPVFFDGRLMFFSIARAHLSDIGFPTPTTYGSLCRDYYAEGLTLPCLRIQADYRDNFELVELCKANIRAPEQFYGDYLAMVGAVRTGERRAREMCERSGVETVLAFLDQYQEYASMMAKSAISRLPAATLSKRAMHDGVSEGFESGLPISATMTVDPTAGEITIDLTDNIDCLPIGLNMTEATVTASCLTAVLNMLGPDVPRASGSFDRVRIKMRENSAIGLPRFPAATSSATTNLAHILIDHIQAMFAEVTDTRGTAYGTVGNPASAPCVSGFDSRRQAPFVNQMVLGYWGGPALAGHDGWLTYGSGTTQGMLSQSSVEVMEQQQPLIIEKLELRPDSGGAGEWEGAQGCDCVIRVRDDAVTFSVNSGGEQFPPAGVAGGLPGGQTRTWKRDLSGALSELPIFFDVTLRPGERLIAHGSGGGGFGDPGKRSREKIEKSISEGLLTEAHAARLYGYARADPTAGSRPCSGDAL
ncbi:MULTISPECIES: hydantoinase B/oxoprolinase family protein [unclassified Mesorhizobium]|uniref:hydantoinase B/oxoprolinase family protein n=1 Tax=unclassified Mesorhizobium TaxID=325217 RepID=UPI002414D446|nr:MULTISPECIES: hydantoinase B/oxoprolinase family protein [unclassified Mesorhizobium]MDG4889979.1 hydantoinase B/oxoprolinase family protein [Mesorhizobium sp. WSM4887]MDG4904121.1 hydantoinase B/oxoprolinase family protein [Mesorhizobium sp. WSM4962]MDG4909148.1 hydantoinase B/oxoprolinase family protein [Mesorhizobium sp. WSM4898]MDG4921772.1 hydantoinase B/oxoprolinase family protein [Mesorhizobium sp. WSM4989]